MGCLSCTSSDCNPSGTLNSFQLANAGGWLAVSVQVVGLSGVVLVLAVVLGVVHVRRSRKLQIRRFERSMYRATIDGFDDELDGDEIEVTVRPTPPCGSR
jgi:hypothetical protein